MVVIPNTDFKASVFKYEEIQVGLRHNTEKITITKDYIFLWKLQVTDILILVVEVENTHKLKGHMYCK